jgi:magnesium-transporting ATPase (P-type)
VFFWYFAEGYNYFATTLLVVFLIGVIINLYQMVQLFDKIFKMAYYEITLNVLRDGQTKPISSLDIVPGDIVFLKDPIKIPFEGIILEGSALIN